MSSSNDIADAHAAYGTSVVPLPLIGTFDCSCVLRLPHGTTVVIVVAVRAMAHVLDGGKPGVFPQYAAR